MRWILFSHCYGHFVHFDRFDMQPNPSVNKSIDKSKQNEKKTTWQWEKLCYEIWGENYLMQIKQADDLYWTDAIEQKRSMIFFSILFWSHVSAAL